MSGPMGDLLDLGTTVGGVRLPFCAMNAPGIRATTPTAVATLAASETGAVVLRTVTVHPFMHPEYRTLHNPGHAAVLPLVRELRTDAPPIVASVAGATADELATLTDAFADAGAALVELNLAEPYVLAALGPFESPEALEAVLGRVASGRGVVLAIRLPARPPLPYGAIGEVLARTGVRVVVAPNDFAGFERLQLETGRTLEVVATGEIRSGYDVLRARSKGACAVEVSDALEREGPGIFRRLAHEMQRAPAGAVTMRRRVDG